MNSCCRCTDIKRIICIHMCQKRCHTDLGCNQNNGNPQPSGNFQMIRIWQGKGLLAAALLPLTIWLCVKITMQKKPELPWAFLLLSNGACCLVSSMGIMLSPVTAGIFAVMGAVRYHDPKRIVRCVLCCIPSIVLGVAYVLIK